MPLPRLSTRRLMLAIGIVAVAVRLFIAKPSADEAEFLQILLGAAGLTILFVSLYFVLWFASLGLVLVVRHVNRTRRGRPRSRLG